MAGGSKILPALRKAHEDFLNIIEDTISLQEILRQRFTRLEEGFAWRGKRRD
jgi:hypothetical protein